MAGIAVFRWGEKKDGIQNPDGRPTFLLHYGDWEGYQACSKHSAWRYNQTRSEWQKSTRGRSMHSKKILISNGCSCEMVYVVWFWNTCMKRQGSSRRKSRNTLMLELFVHTHEHQCLLRFELRIKKNVVCLCFPAEKTRILHCRGSLPPPAGLARGRDAMNNQRRGKTHFWKGF